MTYQIQRSEPAYAQVAAYIRNQIQSGELRPGDMVPSARQMMEQWQISIATATKVLAALRSEGLVEAQPGRGTVVTPDVTTLQDTKWPMTGRYAKARAAQGLIFDSDVTGEVRKDTVKREWVEASILIAQFLNIEVGTRVLQRHSRTYVNDVPTEDTSMFFPRAIIQAAPRLETDEHIQVVPLIEESGHVITRTSNQIRARYPDTSEQQLFEIKNTGIVIEHSHGTYGAEGEALEAVINVRPAEYNVITFDTYEAPVDGSEEGEVS